MKADESGSTVENVGRKIGRRRRRRRGDDDWVLGRSVMIMKRGLKVDNGMQWEVVVVVVVVVVVRRELQTPHTNCPQSSVRRLREKEEEDEEEERR
ncbi:hypothetical protein Pcinc_043572 [Petrolisthes cinctipes]|uniref:Uncharacterized protein n=1 Tax=Petrolisthes cinctipes TaxID=88211 RepID=A0AAE1BFE1_PETCI|nr:hypothetical protein Pcinc_043572 [Petrolisthes cinctipes]